MCDHLKTLPPAFRDEKFDLYISHRGKLEEEDPEIEGSEFFKFSTSELIGHVLERGIRALFSQGVSREDQVAFQAFVEGLAIGDGERLDSGILGMSGDFLRLRGFRGMGLMHWVVLLAHSEAFCERGLRGLSERGVVDVVDDLGASAKMRAKQLGVSFFGEKEAVFTPFFVPDGAGGFREVSSAVEGVQFIREDVGRKDVVVMGQLVELDVLLYLLIYLPRDFDFEAFNEKWLGVLKDQKGVEIDWDSEMPKAAVLDHSHTQFGEEFLGFFAMEDVKKGQIVRRLEGHLRFNIQNQGDVQEYVSNYCYFAFPMDDVMVRYKGQFLCPLISVIPEESMNAIMYMNDSGKHEHNNVSWVNVFHEGLPRCVYVATKDIPRGYEFFCDYILRHETWSLVRGLEVLEIPVGRHPGI